MYLYTIHVYQIHERTHTLSLSSYSILHEDAFIFKFYFIIITNYVRVYKQFNSEHITNEKKNRNE